MKTPIELVIFDCDGVLIDSERLAVRTEAQILASIGWPLSEAEIIERFVGRSAAYMQAEIEREIGRPIDWDVEFDDVYRRVFDSELTPVDGVIDALDRITLPTCVASSGTIDKMRHTLGITGLFERFDGRIFSASDVAHAKPAPDVFLWAASQMGVAHDRCVVIEDSVAGVQAALAAEMGVFAFSGSVTLAATLLDHGAVVFSHMSELPDFVHALAR